MKGERIQSGNSYRAMMVLFIVVLLFPLVQELTGIISERELSGVEEPSGKVQLTAASWLDGSFQKGFEEHHYQWMGMRSTLVRLENQLDHSLFGRLFEKTLVGKDGELFRRGSFNAYTGRDYIGAEQIEYHTNHLTYVQQFLLQKNIRLLPVLTPTKLRCMPEQLKASLLSKASSTNYDAYLESFSKYGLTYLDLTEILSQAVRNEQRRIFPKTGTHWTDYGATVGFQYILDQMKLNHDLDFAGFGISQFENSLEMRGTDSDLGDLLNLLADPSPDTIAYPTLQFFNSPPKVRPKVLVISDSFWWKIYDQQLHQETFAQGSQFRYYNWEVYSGQWDGTVTVPEIDLLRTIEGVEWIILCANEGNLHKFPFGFSDQVLELYGLYQ